MMHGRGAAEVAGMQPARPMVWGWECATGFRVASCTQLSTKSGWVVGCHCGLEPCSVHVTSQDMPVQMCGMLDVEVGPGMQV